MVYLSEDHPIELPNVPISEILWRESLNTELSELGIKSSIEIWILGLFDLVVQRPHLAAYLDRICQDFTSQWDHNLRDTYRVELEMSVTCGLAPGSSSGMERVWTAVPVGDEVVEEDQKRVVTVTMECHQNRSLVWEASVPESVLDAAEGMNLWASDRQMCSYFVEVMDKGQASVRHYAYGAESWAGLVPELTLDAVFQKWLDAAAWEPRDKRDFEILRARFGLDSGQRRTLEEIGRTHHLTRERVRQIVDRRLTRLRHPSRKKRLGEFPSYLEDLFKRNGGVMAVGEIHDHFGSPSDVAGYSPLVAIEMLLFVCGRFYALGYDVARRSRTEDLAGIAWYVKDVYPDDIDTARDAAINELKGYCNDFLYEDLCHVVSEKTQIHVELVRASLRTFRGLEVQPSGVVALTHVTSKAIPRMLLHVLRDLGEPAHFSEIAQRQAELFPERPLTLHNVHSRLGSNPLFRWVKRGTYGLAEWGLPEIRPREEYSKAKRRVIAFLRSLDRPATVVEIEECLVEDSRVPKLSYFVPSAPILLYNNPDVFMQVSRGKWALTEWNMQPPLARDNIEMAVIVLADDNAPWLTFQQLFTAMKSHGWSSSHYSVRASMDREVSKKHRRIRREELHGLNIELYGLAFRDWNQEEVLGQLLDGEM